MPVRNRFDIESTSGAFDTTFNVITKTSILTTARAIVDVSVGGLKPVGNVPFVIQVEDNTCEVLPNAEPSSPVGLTTATGASTEITSNSVYTLPVADLGAITEGQWYDVLDVSASNAIIFSGRLTNRSAKDGAGTAVFSTTAAPTTSIANGDLLVINGATKHAAGDGYLIPAGGSFTWLPDSTWKYLSIRNVSAGTANWRILAVATPDTKNYKR